MDFNIFLARFGLSPDNFVNKLNEPIPFNKGFFYEVEEKKRDILSPCCFEKSYVNNFRMVEYNCSNTEYIDDILRVKRIRYRCSKCGKTFTLKLDGIPRKSKLTTQNLFLMLQDFKKSIPFSSRFFDHSRYSADRYSQRHRKQYVPLRQWWECGDGCYVHSVVSTVKLHDKSA